MRDRLGDEKRKEKMEESRDDREKIRGSWVEGLVDRGAR